MANNSKSTKQTLEQLYLDRNETGDVTFIVESQPIRAHRWVLAAASPKYKAQFYGLRPDENEIHVPIITAAAFNEFLQFFYKESITLTLENIETVLDLAKHSLVNEFVTNCIRFLETVIAAKNLCWAYRLSIVYDIESLGLKCEQQISKHTKEIFATEAFLECDREILSRILKIDYLNCTEEDVFNACIAWARMKCKQEKLNNDSPENLRTALGDAIYQIRFSMMSIEEFAPLYKSVEGLFTLDEILEILYIIGQVDGFKSQKFNQKSRMLPATHYQQNMEFDDFNVIPTRYLSSSESTLHFVVGETNWHNLMRQPIRLRRRRH